jgi:hypothetical protein
MRKFERNEMEQTPPQTEDSAERGFVKQRKDQADPESYAKLGQSDAMDDDRVGDIADEGPGHRG